MVGEGQGGEIAGLELWGHVVDLVGLEHGSGKVEAVDVEKTLVACESELELVT